MIERYLSTDEVCDIIKRTKPTLWAWIKAGDFPPANRTKIREGDWLATQRC
ncbi:Helix-turn-helix domain [Serratia quinivorans]|uniref:Helix-turn-helix domain n=1 Tax=Serratia quinivorans TaxID=137545 RepID=A0A380AVC0_9GAMM|nr:Helix-turn-helix domain [Serratia quinivorans]